MSKKGNARVSKVTPVDEQHQVVTVEGEGTWRYMKKPCRDCPWRKDAVGIFPAEAFRVSAHTSYDMAKHTFGCHNSGTEKSKTCAGFLLRGASHSLAVRLGQLNGRIVMEEIDSNGLALFPDYKAMAVANGVSPDDECLKLTRVDQYHDDSEEQCD